MLLFTFKIFLSVSVRALLQVRQIQLRLSLANQRHLLAFKLNYAKWWSFSQSWLHPKTRAPSDMFICLFFLLCFPRAGVFLLITGNFLHVVGTCPEAPPDSCSFSSVRKKDVWRTGMKWISHPKLFLTFFPVGRIITILCDGIHYPPQSLMA